MMHAIDPGDESFVIRVCTIVDILVQVGGLKPGTSRDQAQALLLSKIVMSFASRDELLEAMIEISETGMVNYIDSRDDRIFLCNTVLGGAVYMMDCGSYRVFYHDDVHRLTPRSIAATPPPLSLGERIDY